MNTNTHDGNRYLFSFYQNSYIGAWQIFSAECVTMLQLIIQTVMAGERPLGDIACTETGIFDAPVGEISLTCVFVASFNDSWILLANARDI